MACARLSLAVLAVLLLAGCTVSTPAHFTTASHDHDFLDAGLQPIPATGQLVALPHPD